MKESSGLIGSILDTLKSLGRSLETVFSQLVDLGIEYEEDQDAYRKAQSQENRKARSEGRDPETVAVKFYKMHAKDKQGNPVNLRIEVHPHEDSTDHFDVYIYNEDEDKELEKEENLPEVRFAEFFEDFVERNGLTGEHFDEVRSSIKVSLRRVVGSDESCVELIAVDPNCCLNKVHPILEQVCRSDEFCESIPETPCTYEINEDADSYDIQTLDQEIDVSNTAVGILRATCLLWNNLQFLRWNAHGEEHDAICQKAESFLWRIQDMMNTSANMAGALGSKVPSLYELLEGLAVSPEFSACAGRDAYGLLRSWLCDYVCTLKACVCNCDVSHQRILEDTIAYYTDEINTLNRILQ